MIELPANPVKQFEVRFMNVGVNRTRTSLNGPYDCWKDSKWERNRLFANDRTISHCWVEVTYGGRTIQRYGAVMKR